jgi:hypothetical protein
MLITTLTGSTHPPGLTDAVIRATFEEAPSYSFVLKCLHRPEEILGFTSFRSFLTNRAFFYYSQAVSFLSHTRRRLLRVL